ncbi:uncharacterized protein LOC132276874 isoform X2 [Cornus florida]|uniref:uncharacterized protein LOC132276874 isoform X2 n=1 Tax=Cornus florida TaxID=4283 RepID=UPI0028A14179|nr:uncharacterized protein LOC132276874 isoform X2 [Cornus florida]
MAGPPLREQALSLIGAANNHGDLAVKLSSLRQAKDILLSIEPSLAMEILPYLVELQCSPESLLRKSLIEVTEEIAMKAMDYSYILMPILLASLKDSDSIVARQSIVSGTNIFCSVLEELSLQFHRRGIVERWLEELWTWMVRFKDAVFAIVLEAGSVGTKLLALKFLETFILLFTADNDSKKPTTEDIKRSGRDFNVSWLPGGHPVLDPVALTSEANRCLGILLELLQSASGRPGSLTIFIVNCLAAIARKRPLYYSSILSALLDFDPNFEMTKGIHTASIQYSLRTAFLGFLRCTYPAIVESRDRLLRALRAMNAGDAADQVIRQVDKMMKNNERASRDARLSKEDVPPSLLPISGDLIKKRSLPLDTEEPSYSHDVASKRIRYGPDSNSVSPVQITDSGLDVPVNGVSPKVPLLDSDLSPVEQMIAMIGALIAEGERGAESLEILISQIHPDLLADIVITNMKHLPQKTPPLTRLGSLPVARESGSSSDPTQVVTSIGPTSSVQSPVLTAQVPLTSSNKISASLVDTSASVNLPADSKRDPRRDPRRLDPRRAAAPVGVPPISIVEDINATHSGAMQSECDANILLNKPLAQPVVTNVENTSAPLMPKIETDLKILGSSVVSEIDQPASKDEVLDDEAVEIDPVPEVNADLDLALSPVCKVDEDSVAPLSSDFAMTDQTHTLSQLEADQLSPAISNTSVSEEASPDLPVLPLYVELTEDQKRNVRKLALQRIIESYSHLQWTECSQTRMALLARLVAQIDADDDLVLIMQEHIVSDYQHQKGHELVMHVLYHLHTLIISDSVDHSSSAADVYEKFLLGVAKSLLHNLPATDKAFSRLLGEVPFLPDSALKLLDDVCCSDIHCAKDVRDGDRVTQGLGAVWSLILGRPLNRQACLDIALKCAVHSDDDIRAKAIRLVANKLYVLSYIAESIEKFATNMFLSAVDQRVSDLELSQPGSIEQRTEGESGSQETSISGSQISEPASENDSVKGAQSDSRIDSSVSFAQAQRLISLLFALCTKKPSLLRLVFDNYAHATKAVKQAVHRHIPILIRALGSSHSELLCLISDPPEGSENLLTQVLNILSEGTTPSSDLIASVKHLYETKLKDVTILIPMLSSLSKNEVLPIFPRLVNLPLDKFQRALAHILQGSAHTGPALTPAEVLVAIHDINPEKDGLALKKITDVCSACFEQRTVFTQQVLAKALNQMVDQTPLPLLFMRTVIQAIDAFPTLVDFVMEILSKLVNKQVWRMPKLWVGFLKCVSQTQPHSFHVLLQLPQPQLESALTKYANLRGPLAAYASQPIIRASLPRSTLVLLGLAKESHVQQPSMASSLHASETSSSVHGATLT